MLILVLMILMLCLRKSGFDRRYMAEAALAMRDVMSREEEPSIVISDPRHEGIDKLYFLLAYLQWQMVGGVNGDSHEFGLRPADLHLNKVGFFQ